MKTSDVPHLNKPAAAKKAAPKAEPAKPHEPKPAVKAEQKHEPAKAEKPPEECSIEGCDNPRAEGSEWCRMHTRRLAPHQAEVEADAE